MHTINKNDMHRTDPSLSWLITGWLLYLAAGFLLIVALRYLTLALLRKPAW